MKKFDAMEVHQTHDSFQISYLYFINHYPPVSTERNSTDPMNPFFHMMPHRDHRSTNTNQNRTSKDKTHEPGVSHKVISLGYRDPGLERGHTLGTQHVLKAEPGKNQVVRLTGIISVIILEWGFVLAEHS